MILREIKNIFIKNRLTEGVDFVRKEWLKGVGNCYINTKIIAQIGDELAGCFKYDRAEVLSYYVNKIPLNQTLMKYNTYGCISQGGSTYKPTEADLQVIIMYKEGFGGTVFRTNEVGVTKNGIDCIETKINVGSEHLATITATRDGIPYNLYMYASMLKTTTQPTTPVIIFNDIHSNIVSISYVKIREHVFFPCQLLKSIPATLDANNIARSAGECGMYDSISGKFYGNVSSTGTFTVEGEVEPETHTGLQQIYQNKLVEGVDYETADWLKADIPSKVTMMELPVNSNNVEYNLQRLAHGNTTIFKTKNNEYKYFFWGGRHDTIGVYDLKGGRDITFKNYNSTVSLFHIKTDSSSVVFNTINVGVFGFPITNILWQIEPGGSSDTIKTSSISVDGVTRYVPCQLLRSIPRNLDAQCKERVAGECGMIDLISGKFYGNVASSGTFTVENDNNE